MHAPTILVGFLAALGLPCISANTITTCGNHGLELGIYENQQPVNEDSTYSNFDPESYKLTVPEYGSYPGLRIGRKSLSKHINTFFPAKANRINFVVNWRGYFVPPTTGNYTVTMSKVDDIMLFWYGQTAYSGWTRSNAVLETTFDTPNEIGGHGETTIPVEAGKYYPFRVMFAECLPPYGLKFAITDPTGKEVVGANKTSGFHRVANFGCKSTDIAPSFPAFGKET